MNKQNDGTEPVTIDTIEHVASAISSMVISGRIVPVDKDDSEAKSLLNLLCRLVEEREP